MRIAIISQSFDVSSGQGVFRAAGELASHLKRAGIEVVRVEAPEMRDLSFYLSVPRLLYAVDADIYHFFMPEYTLGLLHPSIRARSVVTIHDCIPLRAPERHFIHTLWSNFTFRIAGRAQAIHVPSSFTASEVSSLLHLDSSRVRTIPWGVDLDRFSSVRRRRASDDVEVAGYLGGFGPRKNVRWVLQLAERFPNVEFRIAGNGRALSELKSYVASKGLSNVHFIGFVPEDELPQFYAGLDVFLFPSQYEGFGFPVVEALAAGVPYVITGDAGIAQELPVIRVHSFDEFVRAFSAVVRGDFEPIREGPKLLVDMGFEWELVANRFIRLYECVAALCLFFATPLINEFVELCVWRYLFTFGYNVTTFEHLCHNYFLNILAMCFYYPHWNLPNFFTIYAGQVLLTPLTIHFYERATFFHCTVEHRTPCDCWNFHFICGFVLL